MDLISERRRRRAPWLSREVRVWGLGFLEGGYSKFPKIRGTYFGGPYHKDDSILGVYIGVHFSRETTLKV